MPLPTQRPSPLRALLTLPSALVGASLCVLAVLMVLTQQAMRNAYREEVRANLMNAERTANKLAVRVRQVIDQVDQTTSLVKALHETHNPMNLAALRDVSLDASEVARALVISDRLGRVEAHTSEDVPTDVADEDEFKHHSRVRDRRLTLGAPTRNAFGGGWAIPAMRRLERQGGIFDGVVVAYIDPAALMRAFDTDAATGTASSVLGEDNIYRASLVEGRLTVGGAADRRALLADARHSAETLEPTFDGTDHKARFVTVVPIDRYPLYSVISASADEVMSGYYKARRQILRVALGAALLIAIAAFLLWKQTRSLDASRRRAHRADALYRATSEGSLDALFMLTARHNAQGEIEDFEFADANTRGLRLLRHSHEELVGMSLAKRLPALCGSGYLARCRSVVDTRVGFEIEFQLTGDDAHGEWLHHQVVPLEDGIAIISRDITERKTAQDRLDAMARHDPLTQLPNRRYFEEQLEQATARARRSGKPLTLVFLDLDGFKRVNDTLGHATGDRLLIEVAQRLKACVRTTDHVSRLGGDEFTVILEDSGTQEDRMAQCERLLTSLSRPHMLSGQAVIATPSLGVAVYQAGEPLSDLRARADAAMYEAKRAGKACLRWAPTAVAGPV